MKIEQTLDLGVLGEQTFVLDCHYSPATQDVMYLPNGDPGYPGEPEEMDILTIRDETGKEITGWICEQLAEYFFDAGYDSLLEELDNRYREIPDES